MNGRAAFGLAAAQALEFAAQLLVPVVLIRTLSAHDFGAYRLVWLALQTVVAAIGLNVAGNVLYLAAGRAREEQSALVWQSSVYLTGVGLCAAAVLAVMHVSGEHRGMFDLVAFVGALIFVVVWQAAAPFDFIASALGRSRDQVRMQAVMIALRVSMVVLAASVFRSLAAVMVALVIVAMVKAAALSRYARKVFEGRWPAWSGEAWQRQRHAALTVGLGAGLYALRQSVDQWVAQGVAGPTGVAIVALGASASATVVFVRQGFNQIVAPHAVALIAQGRTADALAANASANLRVATVMLPAIGGLCAVAPTWMPWIFTAPMRDSAFVAMIYAIGFAFFCVEVTSVLIAVGRQRFLALQGAWLIAIALAGAYAGAYAFGAWGAACGGALSTIVGCLWSLVEVARVTGAPLATLQRWGSLAALAASATVAACTGLWLPLDAGSVGVEGMTRAGAFLAAYAALTFAWPVARRATLDTLRMMRPPPSGDVQGPPPPAPAKGGIECSRAN